MTEPRLYDVVEVARQLRLHPETIRRYIRRGDLDAIRRPSPRRRGHYLVTGEAIQNFITANRCQGQQCP